MSFRSYVFPFYDANLSKSGNKTLFVLEKSYIDNVVELIIVNLVVEKSYIVLDEEVERGSEEIE